MLRKRVLAILLLALMVGSTVLTGCSKAPNDSDTGSNQQNNQTGTKTDANQQGETSQEKEIIVLKGVSFNVKDYDWNSPIGKVWQEKTGVRIELDKFEDYNARIAVLASSGEWPDLVEQKDDNTIAYDMGVLVPYDDLIEQYGPNIKKMFTYNDANMLRNLNKSAADPHIYTLGRTTFFKDPVGVVGMPYTLQHEVVKEMGYPEIKTLEEYANVIRAYKEKYPTIDGQPTIGITLLCDSYWNFVFATTNPANFATGGSDNGDYLIEPDTGDTSFIQLKPASKEVYRWYNKMWNEGLLDPDSFVQKKDQYLEKIASGRVLGAVSTLGTYSQAMASLRQDGKEWRTYGYYPVALDENYDSTIYWNTYGRNLNWGGLMMTTACKNPEAYIRFADFYCSEEGQLLLEWGIEGVHYTVENGRRVRVPEVAEKLATDPTYKQAQGFELFMGMMPFYQEGIKDSNGDYFRPTTPETVVSTYSAAEKEVLSHYGATTWKDLFKTQFDQPKYANVGNNPFGDTEMSAIITRCREIIQQKITEAITSKPKDFDRIYDEMVADLVDAGMNKINEEYVKKVIEMHELWGIN